ncbi:eukaryotic integral membrane protein-domain-containing protein [Lasiosphaeria miniovina]|uniref:Eukaryotic integral membrane protein-domain-containing protein n=1 Tax=Lasiosphaeria miniovina TaxID=1954250 RepID=A0AA39ZZI5_9PEZI|nr:eukaryotic integral membrane protein-domain-containing protein [Lasiosphaeria miniovina]KAK0706528.1 eukaryotic integral membrane protein-domain-containing protein [Lasiosphaeria miniovina]
MPPRINIPPVTRILLVVLTLQSVLSAAIRYRQWSAHTEVVLPYLNLVPQLSLVYPWTFLTTTLVESNVFTLTIAYLTLYHGGRYLERAWSSREFAKFLLIAALIPNTLCFGTMIIFFAFTRNERWTLMTIAGTIPLQISFLVAFSQLVPAHTVTLFRGILSMRVPRFPLVYIGLVTLLCLSPMLTSASFFLSVYGLLTSWTYLRFYKPVFPDLDTSQSSSLRGDASDTFAFAEFFPGPVRPFVESLSAQVFGVLVAMRLCAPFSAADISAARGETSSSSFVPRGVPGSARAEAERRRALALKALDQRLHAATASSASRAQSAPPPPSIPQPPPPSASGPTVQTQPHVGTQSAMTTSQAGGLLGETSYNPDGDGDRGSA